MQRLGMDAFVAALKVGPNGRASGRHDDAQLAKMARLAGSAASTTSPVARAIEDTASSRHYERDSNWMRDVDHA